MLDELKRIAAIQDGKAAGERYAWAVAEIERLSAELSAIRQASAELLEALRDKWHCKNADAMTLCLAAILAGIAEEWVKNPPPNGFTHTAVFQDPIGKLTIDIRKIDGKTPAEVIKELQTELNETWTDDEGTVWTRPTAWAYAQACKVVNGRQLTAEKRCAELEAKLAEMSYNGAVNDPTWP